jgi:cytochrome c peroxidase
MTSDDIYNVGLSDGLEGHVEFNPPSLRNVGHTAPYLHDGRARTLEEVIDTHHRRWTDPPAEADRSAILAYLRSL